MPKLNITSLDAELRQKNIRPIYIIAGDEMHLRRSALKNISQTVTGGSTEGMRSFNGGDAGAREIIEAARSIPMFGGRMLVVVRDGEKLKKEALESLSQYAEKPVEGSVLIIDAQKIDGRSKFVKTAEKSGAVIECKALYANQIPSWINMEMREQGKKISQEAARYLADMVGNDLGQIVQSIERVSLYVGNRPLIELKDVEEAVVETAQRTVFELGDAVGNRKVERALHVLTSLIDSGQAPVFILNMISRHVRLLMKSKELGTRTSDASELARHLGVHPFFAKDYAAQSRNFSAGELRRFFRSLSRCDRALKSSRLPKERILEKLIIELCTQKNAPLEGGKN